MRIDGPVFTVQSRRGVALRCTSPAKNPEFPGDFKATAPENGAARIDSSVGALGPALGSSRRRRLPAEKEIVMHRTVPESRRPILILLLVLLLASVPNVAMAATAVDDWSAIGNQAIVVNAARAGTSNIDFAYMFIAIYDAVNAIDGGHTVFAVTPTSPTAGASLEAATAAAAYTMLKWLFPTQEASYLTPTYNAYVAALPAAGKAAGIAVGTEVGNALIAQRTGDGRNASVPYTFQTGPGQYQATPGGAPTPVTPWLAQMRTFAIEDSTQFRAPAPPDLHSGQWAKDFNLTKDYGALSGSLRTVEQTENGLFYAENPGQQINRNVRRVATDHNLSLVDAARFFAQVYVSIADAQMTTWNSKYYYNFWRPVTAIRAADTDGNHKTDLDAGWLPLVLTPSHPEYPAAHPTVTGAFAYAIGEFFGTKNVDTTFTSTSVAPGVTTELHVDNIDDIVEHVMAGRIYGGMHYHTSTLEGSKIARKVAHYVSLHYFLPVK